MPADEPSPIKAREAELEKYGQAKALIKQVHRLTEEAESISTVAADLGIHTYPRKSKEFPPGELIGMWTDAVEELRSACDEIPPRRPITA